MIRFARAFGLLVLIPAVAAAAAPPMEALLDSDTDAVLVIENVPEFLESWSASPLGRAWDDPDVASFFAPLRDSLRSGAGVAKSTAEFGASPEELLRELTGGLAVVFPDFGSLDPLLMDREEGEAPADWHGPFAIVAEVGDDPGHLERLLGERDARWRDDPLAFRIHAGEESGIELHLAERLHDGEALPQPGWARVAGRLVLAEPEGYLRELVHALAAGEVAEPLADDPLFTAFRRREGEADAWAYVRLEGLVRVFTAAVDRDDDLHEPNPIGLTAPGILETLKLENFRATFLALRLDGASMTFDNGVFLAGRDGLASLFDAAGSPAPRPAFLGADRPAAGAARFSYPIFWRRLRALIAELSPMIDTTIDQRVHAVAVQTGVNLETDLLDRLGDEIFSVSDAFAPPAPGPMMYAGLNGQQLVGIRLADRAGFETALTTLIEAAGGGDGLFTTEEYAGTAIHRFRMPFEPPDATDATSGFAWALRDDWFLLNFGSTATIRGVLDRMQHPGESIWDDPRVTAMLDGIAAEPGAVSVYDTAGMLASVCAMMAAEADADDELPIDPAAAPTVEALARFLGRTVAVAWPEPEGYFGRTRLFGPR